MKKQKLFALFTAAIVNIGLFTFIPSASPAQAAASCSGQTCSQTFSYTGAVQQFTPTNVGMLLTFTLNGASGGSGGSDASSPGGAGAKGSRISFTYVNSTTNPINLYVGGAGGSGVSSTNGGGGVRGLNPWSAFNGGWGGGAGGAGTSGAGGAGGAATVVAVGDKTDVLGVAAGGGGGGGANVSHGGSAGNAELVTEDPTTLSDSSIGANGQDLVGGSNDGGGGGGGGGGVVGGKGGLAIWDGSGSPKGGYAGKSGVSGTSTLVSKTVGANGANGSITISWPNGPSASTLPSFTVSTTAKIGQTLVPADGVFTPNSGSITISNRRWQISTDGTTWTDITPLVSGNYTILAADAGKYLRFTEDVADSTSSITYSSLSSLRITDVPVFTAENPTDSAANALVDTNFAGYTFVATGYRNNYTISSGALPSGVTLNASTGVLSGKPTATGIFKYKVKVTNDAGTDETVELSLVVGKAPVFTSDDSLLQSINRVTNPIRVASVFPAFTFTADAYPAASFELKTDATTLATCSNSAVFPNCAYSYETLSLPPGLTFDAATGKLTGSPTKSGAYAFAIKATNSVGSSLDFVHMSIAAKAPQAFTLSSDKNAVTIVKNTTVTATVTATGGDGNGAYSFSVDSSSTSICSVATASANSATVTAIAAGNCVINGTKAADGGFASSKTSITIPVNKAPQTTALVATPRVNPLSFVLNGQSHWIDATGGNGTGAVTYTIDPSSAAVCQYYTVSGSSYMVTMLSAGTCLLNVTKAADNFFLAQTTQVSLQINKASPTSFYMNTPSTVNWNATTAPTANLTSDSGYGTGAVTYTVDPASSSVCSVSGTVVTAKSAGACLLSATKAGDNNYNSQTTAQVTWTINMINQPALTATGATVTGTKIVYSAGVPYVANPTYIAIITVTGGAGTGTFSYTPTGASNCKVAGAGNQAYVTVSPTSGGIGWCLIGITKAADVNYNAQTTDFLFSIQTSPQSPLVATPGSTSMDWVATTPVDANTAAKTQITVTGGLGNGAITYYTANTGICSVSATGLITNITAGTCNVTVTKAADSFGNYSQQTTTLSVVFNKLNQTQLDAVSSTYLTDFTWSPKATAQVSIASGGNGSGNLSYAVDPASSGICTVNSSTGLITDVTAGTCKVIATKAADTNYNASSDSVTVVFKKVSPTAITLTASVNPVVYTTAASKNQSVISASGGANSTGSYTFYIDPMSEEYCSIANSNASQIWITGNLAGFCQIIVIKAGDVNYLEQRAVIGVTINKMTQTISATSSNGNSPGYKDSPTAITVINVTGQAGTGITRYTVDTANSTSNCVVDQANGNVTATNVGSCKVTVSRDGDDNVLASNSVVLNLSIGKINQTAITLTPATELKAATPGAPFNTSALTIGTTATGTGNFTKIVSATPAVCAITGGGDPISTATPSIVVTAIKDGTCTLTYSKLGDTNYNAVTNTSASFTINKASQADLSTSISVGSASMPYVASPKATATITATGGSGTGALNYSVDPSSSGVCTVNSTTGVVTDVTAGTCIINVKRVGDTSYVDSAVKQVTIVFGKIDQAAFSLTAAKTALKATTSALDTTTVSVSGGSGTGTVSYSIDPASASICSISGTTVTGNAPGDCIVIATKAADTNYNVATTTVKITVTKGTQAALTGSWWQASVAYTTSTTSEVNYLVTSGGTGSGELIASIDSSSAAICSNARVRTGYMNQITVSALSAGTCSVTVNKSGGTAWENSNSVTVSFPITKIDQAAVTATASKTTVGYFDSPNTTFTVTPAGGSGTGAYSVSISTPAVCTDVSSNGVLTIKVTAIGTCSFTVSRATDTNYKVSANSSTISVTVQKGTQAALVVTASPSAIDYVASPKATSTLSISGGSGSGAVTTSVDSGSTAICSYNDATKVVTALQSGRCDITVTKAGDALFNAATTKITIVVNKTIQAKLNLSAVTPQLLFSESPKATTALVVSGGSGTGAVSYAVTPGSSSICSIEVNNSVATVTANYFGYCVVTATKAGDLNYADATASTTIRIAMPGTLITATVADSTVQYAPAPAVATVVTVLGSKTGDLITYSVDSASKNICSVAGNGATANVTALGIGVCNILVINVSKADDGTLVASSSVATVNITKASQSVTATAATPSVYFSTPAATDVITVTGGITAGQITASIDASTAGNCSVSVSANKITMTALSVGDCLVNFTKTGDALYSDFTGSINIVIMKSKQANLIASASPAALTYSASTPPTSTLNVTGGSGTGEISYEVSEASASICAIDGVVITAITGGDCVVNITKDGDNNYSPATTSVTIKIAKSNQAAFTVTASPGSLTFDPDNEVTSTLEIDGGSGTGEVTFSIAAGSSSVCSVSENIVTVIKAGSCVINAVKAADPYFNSATASVTITVAKAAQPSLEGTIADGETDEPQWNGITTTQVEITGGAGTGALSMVGNTPAVCSVSLTGDRINVTALAAGTCSFTVTKAMDSDYLVSAPLTYSITVSSAATDLTLTVKPVGKSVAGGQGAIDLVLKNSGDAKANGATVSYTLPTGITALSGMTAGCVLTNSTLVTCTTSKIIDPDTSVTFTIPVALAATLTGGVITTGGAATITSVTPDSDESNNFLTGEPANFVVSKAPTAFSKGTLNNMQTGKDFSDQITANGFPEVTYIVSAGALPAGLTLDEATGEITGSPTGSGKYTFTITAFNSIGAFSQVYTGTIAPAPFVTAPAAGFGPNTLPAGTKITIGGVNLDLITSAVIGGKSVKIASKLANAITLEVPNSLTAGQVDISLVYAQGTLSGGTFTYTGVTKTTPTLVVSAGNGSAGAGEPSRTLSTAVTATGVEGEISLPVSYTSTTPKVCTITSGKLNFIGAGTCIIYASSAANTSFNAGLSANVTLTVTKSNQTITVTLPKDTVPATPTTDAADGFDLTAVASSALPVVFTSTTADICDVTEDGHVSGIKAGRCKVTVNQPGDARFNAAPAATMEFDIVADSGTNPADQGDPLHPTPLPNGQLVKSGSSGFTWDRKLGFLNVQTYGVWLGKINATIEFTIDKKNYKCSVDFGVLKAMPGKTAADIKAAFAAKIFKAPKPLCSNKTEAAALAALKKGYAGLQIKATFTRYLMWPTTYKPVNEKTKKPIPTHRRIAYITLG